MHIKKPIFSFLLSVWLLASVRPCYSGHAGIMINAEDGRVLYELDATRAWYPASLTKVMTLYLTFEALQNGKIDFFDAMPVSWHASQQPTSKLGLRAGDYLTVRDAILALITRSANDAAVVLSEHLAGSEEKFAVQMTQKARALGMGNTRFINATGLPNDWQVTTAKDMALLAWNIYHKFPEYYRHFASRGFDYKGQQLRSINKFVSLYPGAEGMKTGYTCGSGYNLIASAERDGKRLIGVILGGVTSIERYGLMTAMMDAGFEEHYPGLEGKHIATMANGYPNIPPYQLNCGSGAYQYAGPAKARSAAYLVKSKASRHHRKSGKKAKRVLKAKAENRIKSAASQKTGGKKQTRASHSTRSGSAAPRTAKKSSLKTSASKKAAASRVRKKSGHKK